MYIQKLRQLELLPTTTVDAVASTVDVELPYN